MAGDRGPTSTCLCPRETLQIQSPMRFCISSNGSILKKDGRSSFCGVTSGAAVDAPCGSCAAEDELAGTAGRRCDGDGAGTTPSVGSGLTMGCGRGGGGKEPQGR